MQGRFYKYRMENGEWKALHFPFKIVPISYFFLILLVKYSKNAAKRRNHLIQLQ